MTIYGLVLGQAGHRTQCMHYSLNHVDFVAKWGIEFQWLLLVERKYS